MTESLVRDLKAVFENHNIDLPDEKVDKVEEQQEEIDDLKAKLNEKHDEVKNLHNQLQESKRDEIINYLGENLAQTEFDRFKKLTEDLTFTSSSRFEEKAKTVLETYFKKNDSEDGGGLNEEDTNSGDSDTKNDTHSDLVKQASRFL